MTWLEKISRIEIRGFSVTYYCLYHLNGPTGNYFHKNGFFKKKIFLVNNLNIQIFDFIMLYHIQN